jgi:hypothetical protein
MEGEPLAAVAGLLHVTGGASLIGTKTLVLTDLPALYLHDTGGLFGQEQVLELRALTGAGASADLYFSENSTVLRGVAAFQPGKEAFVELNKDVGHIADVLAARRLPSEAGGAFEAPLPVSVRCRFAQGPERLRQQVAAVEPDVDELLQPFVGWDVFCLALWRKPPSVAVLIEHLRHQEFAAAVEVRENRVRLRRRDTTLLDVPLAQLDVTDGPGGEVIFSGEVTVAGLLAEAISITLPSKALAARLRAAASGPRRAAADIPLPAPRGVVELVHVKGRLAPGQAIDTQADAVLTDDVLELRSAQTGQALCRFCFAAPAVGVAGTTECFIIASDVAGPVVVSGGAEHFRARLVEHEAVRAAARRTLASGPFLAFAAGDPVSCRAGEQALEVLGAGISHAIPYSEVRGVQRDKADGKEAVRVLTTASGPPLQLTGEQNVLGALSTAVQARLIAREYADRADEVIGAILGLERDYFIYTLFGPLYELHAAFQGPGGQAPLDGELAVPATLEEALALANLMVQGLGPIRNHLDKVCYYLPSLLVKCDAELCRVAGGPLPVWLKLHERGYRVALAGAQPVLSEARLLREFLLRVRGVEGRLKRGGDYSGAALSLVLGAALNPALLVGAAQQALGVSRQASRLQEEQSESVAELVERVVGQWNYLVRELVPALWHHVVDAIFPLRAQLYQRLTRQLAEAPAAERDALRAGLDRRLATLTTFLHYPEAETSRLTRGEVAAAARRLRDRLSYEGLHAF